MYGGYVMIDCGALELTSESKVTIPGLYDRVKNAVKSGKPIMACNCTFESAVMTPIYTMVTLRPSGNFIATASTLQIEVDDDDGVVIHNMIQPSPTPPEPGESDLVLVDFKGATTGETVTGLFAALTSAYESGKPIFGEHFHFTGTDNAVVPIVVNDITTETVYMYTVGYSYVSVSSADELTLN